jgi:hypothetical protein
MTLRWVRAFDQSPHSYPRRVSEAAKNEDWVLYSGAWSVGSIANVGGFKPHIAWGLTGAPALDAPIVLAGHAGGDVAAAKEQLVAAFRAWAAWAGIRREGTEAPRWLKTIEHAPHMARSCDPDADWLLASGGYDGVGRVHRPRGGPRHDPHWQLFALTATDSPTFASSGWAATEDDAKSALIGAWRSFSRMGRAPGAKIVHLTR